MIRPPTRILLWILAALVVAIGIDNLDRPLANPDEGRYAEIAREMAQSGDWITPRLNGLKYFEKPPLQYWATAASLTLLPHGEYAARLYVALCGLATLLLVAFTGRRLGTRETGLAAAIALASSPYFMVMSGVVTLDTGLTLWTTLTFCAYLLAEREPTRSPTRRRWMLLAWAAMALAVLSKGLVGLVFPAGALLALCVLRRDLRPVARLEWAYGLVIFLAISAPWFVAVSYQNPEFPRFFFVHEHWERFLSASHRRTEPWWYFLPIVAVGFLPWLFALPSAFAHGWRLAGDPRATNEMRLALAWAFVVVAFFSISSSKLPAYILPAFPPLALVIGRYLVHAPTRKLAWQVLPMTLVAMALVALALQIESRAREPWTRELYGHAQPLALMAALALLAACAIAAAALWRGRRWTALVAIAIGMGVVLDRIEDAYEALSPRQSGKSVATLMAAHASPEARLYSVRYFEHSVPFYLRRTLTLVAYVDEFERGIASEPTAHIPTLEAFHEDWLRPGEALAIMNPATFAALGARGLPMQRLHEDPRRVLVRKP
ncbi:MAG TPA: phospholipid carrier-dependent glycosyltransferase [Usitatibacter sp.]|nr:phospholipid carrier-dependent glycosyltransferase [Usitatibacter sp.]